MVKVYGEEEMVWVIHTMENIKMIKNVVMVYIVGLMEINMKDNFIMI